MKFTTRPLDVCRPRNEQNWCGHLVHPPPTALIRQREKKHFTKGELCCRLLWQVQPGCQWTPVTEFSECTLEVGTRRHASKPPGMASAVDGQEIPARFHLKMCPELLARPNAQLARGKIGSEMEWLSSREKAGKSRLAMCGVGERCTVLCSLLALPSRTVILPAPWLEAQFFAISPVFA